MSRLLTGETNSALVLSHSVSSGLRRHLSSLPRRGDQGYIHSSEAERQQQQNPLFLPQFRPDSSLLEVLQMDFEVDEFSSPLDSQVIVWKLELPHTSREQGAKTEGAMRIYTTQRDFVGLAPLVMVSPAPCLALSAEPVPLTAH
ncbi:hypothetical protein CRUP_028855 [Coryphaenoides rupestris]|nr:hypothetical protein CRUP_028855 [Coryphaenoides rupestris]